MTSQIAPIRRQIVVPGDPAASFDVFTREIGGWWPLDGKHSVFGPGGTVAFEDGHVVETASSGSTSVWADVLEFSPGNLLRLAWFPGSTREHATEVRVSFVAVDNAMGGRSTLVTLEHDGWERRADPETSRREYESGWPPVVALFGAAARTSVAAESSEKAAADENQTRLMLRLSDQGAE